VPQKSSCWRCHKRSSGGERREFRAVPAIYPFREFVAAGGLISYSGSLKEAHRQVGLYVRRILKGEKPADLLVQRSFVGLLNIREFSL
jgi:ABC-type uncharacterized transport system substrate-binding protein